MKIIITTFLMLGFCYSFCQTETYRQQIENYTKKINDNKDDKSRNWYFYFERSNAYYKLGIIDSAILDLKKADQVSPGAVKRIELSRHVVVSGPMLNAGGLRSVTSIVSIEKQSPSGPL